MIFFRKKAESFSRLQECGFYVFVSCCGRGGEGRGKWEKTNIFTFKLFSSSAYEKFVIRTRWSSEKKKNRQFITAVGELDRLGDGFLFLYLSYFSPVRIPFAPFVCAPSTETEFHNGKKMRRITQYENKKSLLCTLPACRPLLQWYVIYQRRRYARYCSEKIEGRSSFRFRGGFTLVRFHF